MSPDLRAPGQEPADEPRRALLPPDPPHPEGITVTITPATPTTLRLRLDPAPSVVRTVDGAWWPHSTDVEAELPMLLEGVAAALGQIHRISINPSRWDAGASRLSIGSSLIRVGRITTTHPNLASLVRRGHPDVVLLVIPPTCGAAEAEAAMAAAADPADRSRPSEILERAGVAV